MSDKDVTPATAELASLRTAFAPVALDVLEGAQFDYHYERLFDAIAALCQIPPGSSALARNRKRAVSRVQCGIARASRGVLAGGFMGELMDKKNAIAVGKIEKLYQGAMDLRDRSPSFAGDGLLEQIYTSQYLRAYRITHDVAQFAWETRLYRKLQRSVEGRCRLKKGGTQE